MKMLDGKHKLIGVLGIIALLFTVMLFGANQVGAASLDQTQAKKDNQLRTNISVTVYDVNQSFDESIDPLHGMGPNAYYELSWEEKEYPEGTVLFFVKNQNDMPIGYNPTNPLDVKIVGNQYANYDLQPSSTKITKDTKNVFVHYQGSKRAPIVIHYIDERGRLLPTGLLDGVHEGRVGDDLWLYAEEEVNYQGERFSRYYHQPYCIHSGSATGPEVSDGTRLTYTNEKQEYYFVYDGIGKTTIHWLNQNGEDLISPSTGWRKYGGTYQYYQGLDDLNQINQSSPYYKERYHFSFSLFDGNQINAFPVSFEQQKEEHNIYIYYQGYPANGKNSVDFVDENGSKIKSTEYKTGNFGDYYRTTEQQLPGYSFVNLTVNNELAPIGARYKYYDFDRYHIVYHFKKVTDDKITIRYLDLKGNSIKLEETFTGAEGAEFTLPTDTEVAGYAYMHAEVDGEDAKVGSTINFTSEPHEIIYYYDAV